MMKRRKWWIRSIPVPFEHDVFEEAISRERPDLAKYMWGDFNQCVEVSESLLGDVILSREDAVKLFEFLEAINGPVKNNLLDRSIEMLQDILDAAMKESET